MLKLASIINSLGRTSSKSRLSLRIATIGIAVSVAVIVMAQLIVSGFRARVQEKLTDVVGFAHVSQSSLLFEMPSMTMLDSATKAALDQVVAPQQAVAVVQANVVAQHNLNTIGLLALGADNRHIAPDKIHLSKTAAKELGVDIGDRIDITTFATELPERHSLLVDSIYSSDMSDVERSIAFVSTSDARLLADFAPDIVSYYQIDKEVDIAKLDLFAQNEGLSVATVESRVPQIFDWLGMIDQNLTLVLIIMTVVAIINVVTATLIVILENTPTIGTLRALGMSHSAVSELFLLKMSRCVARAMVCGLALGLGLGGVQYFFDVVELDSTSYFVSSIPIAFDWVSLSIYVVVVGFAIVVSVVLPTGIIAKMSITQAVKYE